MPFKEMSKIKQAKLSHERLLELLDYNRETGIFINKVDRFKSKNGETPGTCNHKGYINISLDNTTYLAHRLAWFYIFEQWPVDQIDHINRVRNDNRISNLREVNHYGNMLNRGKEAEKRSGVNGIIWAATVKRWIVKHNGSHLCFADSIKDGIQFKKDAESGNFVKPPKRKQSNAAEHHSGVESIWWDKNGKDGRNWRVDYKGKHLCTVRSVEEGTEAQKQAELGCFVKPVRIGGAEKQSIAKGICWSKNAKAWAVTYKKKFLCHTSSVEEGIEFQKQFELGTFIKPPPRPNPNASAIQSGISGINWDKHSESWSVRINGKRLGRRKGLLLAIELKNSSLDV